MLPPLRYDPLVVNDSRVQAALDMIHIFLRVGVTLQSIGQSVKVISAASLEADRAIEDPWKSTSTSFRPEIVLKLSSLLRRCLDFSRKDLPNMSPAPWARGSSFLALKGELDVLFVTHVNGLAVDGEALRMLQHQEIGAGHHVLGLSMLYTMRILLDAVFMPVSVTPVSSSTDELTIDDSEDAVDSVSGISTSRRMVYFPGAPQCFWCERTATSIRSARALALLARSVLEQGRLMMVCQSFLYSPCHVQSSLRIPCHDNLHFMIAPVPRLQPLPSWSCLFESATCRG